MLPKEEGAGREMEWDAGVGRHRLLYVEWINKVPMGQHREVRSISYEKPQRGRVLKKNVYIYVSLIPQLCSSS